LDAVNDRTIVRITTRQAEETTVMPHYQTRQLPVEGGSLHVGCWGLRGPVVVASHGLTATHVCWQALADQLGDEVRLLAPDHRGRGGSNAIRGPWGMPAHAADLVALLDAFGLPRADLLVGHSMGAFVAVVAAARYPQRFLRLLLIDGGLPSIDKLPSGMSTEQLVAAVVGPSLARLDMRFGSVEAYRDFWRQHPAFADAWSPYIERYADYDLVGTAPELRSGVSKDAILRDVETQLMSDLVPQALQRLSQPVRFLKAPRGILNGEPLYSDAAIAQAAQTIRNLSHATIPDVNHFTISISATGARALAAEVRALL
jgi:lipase